MGNFFNYKTETPKKLFIVSTPNTENSVPSNNVLNISMSNTPVTPPNIPVTPPNTPVTPPNIPVTPPNTPVTPPNIPVTEFDSKIKKFFENVKDDINVINKYEFIVDQDCNKLNNITEGVETVIKEISELAQTDKLDYIIKDMEKVSTVLSVIEEIAEKTEEISKPFESICDLIDDTIENKQ